MEECGNLIKTRFPNINEDIYSYCESKCIFLNHLSYFT